MSSSHDSNHFVRQALLITLCPLLPIPLIDFFLVPILARRLFVPLVKEPYQARWFIQKDDSFCLGCLASIVLYPFFKIFKIAKFIFQFKSYMSTFQYWFYKAHLTVQFFAKNPYNETKQIQEFAKNLDIFLRSKEMNALFQRNLQSGWQNLGIIDSIQRILQMATTTHDVEHPHELLLHTEIMDSWLNEQMLMLAPQNQSSSESNTPNLPQ